MRLALTPMFLVAFVSTTMAGDWTDWRGPKRDGTSPEKNLPEKWSPDGENLAWKVNYGGRSAPIVFGDHVYLQNTAGKGETEQERILCFNSDTGKLLWEYRFNIFQSDVPAHRVAWASPAVDPATGNVYVFGVNDLMTALTRDGKKIWERSITEEMSPFTTHGGRTVSPVIDGDLVIVSTPTSTWGDQANRSQRFLAMDKRNGGITWISTPGGRPYDTTYGALNIVTVNGMRLLISGGADGAVHAMKPQTGERVWSIEIAKRGINTGVVMNGNIALVSHGDENLDSNDLGMIAAIDATGKGKLDRSAIKWSHEGFLGGFSAPVIDGDRAYQVDNNANMEAFDVVTGRRLWKQNLGTVQKAALVLADGKIYVGTESGKFYILKPHGDRCEILSEAAMPVSQSGLASEHIPEPILSGAAVSRGRVYVATTDHLYAIGKTKHPAPPDPDPSAAAYAKGEGAATWLQVSPTELVLSPGQTVTLHAKLYDAQGRFLREDKAEWSLQGLKGTVTDGKFTVDASPVGQAGTIKAAVGGLTGAARARVVPPLPWTETFESLPLGSVPPHWISATAGKYRIAELEGKRVLEKQPDETLFKRMRVFFGPSNWSDYTVEADIRLNQKRRQLGDAGIIAQRYTLFLFGNSQRLEMNSWQPEVARAAAAPYEWKADTWYRLKLRVDNQADGKTRIRGKAWPTAEAEPAAWQIDRIDPIPNREGSPGIFADAQFGVYFANLKVTPNR